MSFSSKKNGAFSLEDEPPPNKVIGPPKDPAEVRKFLEERCRFQERAKEALNQPFFLKPHVLQQSLNPTTFSVKSLISPNGPSPLPAQSRVTPPELSQSPLYGKTPPIVGVPLPFSPSLHCPTPLGMKVEGTLNHGKLNGSESAPLLQPTPMNIKCPQSGFFAPISVLTCSPPNIMANFPAAAFPTKSPLPAVQSVSPLTFAPFSPMFISNAMATSLGNSPRSTMGASVTSDGSSGYKTEGSKGQRSEYTVGQNHPKPNYMRQEEEDESDVEYLEDSNSSGRVSPVDDLDDIDIDDNPPPLPTRSPTGTVATGCIEAIKTSGQSSAGDIDTKEDRLLHLQPSSAHSSGKHACAVGEEQDGGGAQEAGGASGERPSSGISSMSSSDTSALSLSPEPFKLCAGSEVDGPNAEVFCHVPGRLSLLSATPKYRVTVEEIRRRLSHPESLNASILGGLLRRAKSKNGGHVLRQKLETIGVKLPPGKRKTSELTLLTAMVEGEALHLAKDYQQVTKREFPHTAVAQHIAKKQMSSSANISSKERIRTIKAAKTLIKEIQSVVQPFTMVREWPENSDHLSQGLARYNLVTHSFGPLALSTGIGSVLASLEDLQDIYEGKKQLNNPPVSCSSSSVPVGCLQMQQQQMGIVPHPSQAGPSHLGTGCVKQEVGQHTDHNLDNCPVVMPTQFE